MAIDVPVTVCKKHPKYKGIRRPRTNCDTCWTILAEQRERSIPEMATLQEKAMIVTLRTGAWSGRSIDRTVTSEVEKAHNAETDSGRYMKFLLPPSALDPVEKVIAKAKVWIYNNTYPWTSAGDYILPVSRHLECVTKMQEFKSELETEVDKLENEYQRLKNESKKRLGTMWNENEYPASIRSKFRLDVLFSPIPNEGDWRVHLSEDEVKRLSKDIEDRNKQLLTNSTRELYTRLRDVVKKLSDRIDAKAEDTSAKFHSKSLMESILKVIHSVDDMNIAEDQELKKLSDDLLKELGDLDPKLLQKDDAYRVVADTVVKSSLDKIDQKMKMFGGGETENA